MRRHILRYSGVAAGIVLLSCGGAQALTISSADLWDVSSGVTVTGYSPVMGPPLYDSSWRSDIRDMFGGRYGLIEPGNTLFQDFQAPGTVHWVEWQTANPVSINAYNLVAAHDGAPRDANYRGITSFALYAWSGSSWDMLDQYSPSNPYGGGVNYTAQYFLELYDTFPTVTAQRFRAEFTQRGSGGNASGPRICELDGYYVQQQTVPEPASTILLLGLGLTGLTGLRRKMLK